MKIYKFLTILLVSGLFCATSAHDFWVDGKNDGDKFKADIGYGHDFPKAEPIPSDRTKLFDPLYIVSENGAKTTLKQSGKNYHFESAKLGKGSYVLAGYYKPTFWTQDTDDKWHMDGTRANVKNPKMCELSAKYAKQIVSVDGAKSDFVKQPIGQTIEIIPVTDPTELVAGKPFVLKVFLDGKPLKQAKVVGVIEGYLQDKYTFSGRADLRGEIEIIAIKEGKWLFKVTHEREYKDKKVCESEKLQATLVVDIKK